MAVRRSLVILLLLAIAMPLWAFINAQGGTDNSAVERLKTLQLYQVGRGDVALSVSAIGTLEAERSTQLSFLVAGRVVEVLVQRDDYVLAGDVLVRLDNTLQRIAYEQALLNVQKAELALQDLLEVDADQIRIAEAAVDSAWAGLNSINNAISGSDIQAAQLSYDQAVKNAQELALQRDAAPSGQYDLLTAQAGEASVNAEIARLRLEELQTRTRPQAGAAYARVLQAQQELERVKAGPPQAQIDIAQSSITQAESQVDRAKLAYDRTVLVAPFDGVVASLNVEVGALIAPSLGVLELVDLSPLGLTVQVDEVDIGIIEEGLPVQVELDALPDVLLPATLERIAPSGTNSGGIVTYAVEIELEGDDPRARVGMTAEATIIVQEKKNTVFVPNLYLRIDRRTGEAFVNVLQEDNTVQEVRVRLGLQGQQTSEIVSGLAEGDIIVIDLGGRGIQSFFGG